MLDWSKFLQLSKTGFCAASCLLCRVPPLLTCLCLVLKVFFCTGNLVGAGEHVAWRAAAKIIPLLQNQLLSFRRWWTVCCCVYCYDYSAHLCELWHECVWDTELQWLPSSEMWVPSEASGAEGNSTKGKMQITFFYLMCKRVSIIIIFPSLAPAGEVPAGGSLSGGDL